MKGESTERTMDIFTLPFRRPRHRTAQVAGRESKGKLS